MNWNGVSEPEANGEQNHQQRHLILFQFEERSCCENGIRHNLFDHNGVSTDKCSETVDRPFEQILLVERRAVENEVNARGEQSVWNGDDEVETEQFFRSPQRFDHFRVEKNDHHVDDRVPNMNFNETMR